MAIVHHEIHPPAPVRPGVHGTLLPGLRRERLERGWSVNRLRKEANVKHDTVSYLERLERGAASTTVGKLPGRSASTRAY